MHIGGVLLGAGMEMNLLPGDYLFGEIRVKFLVGEIVCAMEDWVILQGYERPTERSPWRARRIRVRITALKRSLALA